MANPGPYAAEQEAWAERRRLAALRRYDILDTPPEAAFDHLALAAATVAGVPMAMISLVDEGRQWFKSVIGLGLRTTVRAIGCCDHVVAEKAAIVVPDLRTDERFATNPLVTGPPHLQFYAGFPLLTPDDHAIGTLCVLHTEPSDLDRRQRDALAALADQVVLQLELRSVLGPGYDEVPAEGAADHRDRTPTERWGLRPEDPATAMLSRFRPDGSVVHQSDGARRRFATSEGGLDITVVHLGDRAPMRAAWCNAVLGHAVSLPVRARGSDGSWRRLDTALVPHLDDDGQVDEVACVSRDVTRRVDLAARFAFGTGTGLAPGAGDPTPQVALDAVALAAVGCDRRGRLTFFNSTARAILGRDPDPALDAQEVVATYWLRGPDGEAPLAADRLPWRRALAGTTVDGELLLVSRPGLPQRALRCTGRRLVDASGAPSGAIVFMTDVSASHRAHGELAAADTELASAAIDLEEARHRHPSSPRPHRPVGALLASLLPAALVADDARRRTGPAVQDVVRSADEIIDLSEPAVGAARDRLAYLQSLVGIGWWWCQPPSATITLSPVAGGLLGLADETIRHEDLAALVHPEDRSAFDRYHVDLASQGGARVLEYRLADHLPTGGGPGWRWLRSWGNGEIGEDGVTVSRVDHCVQDTTAERRRERRYLERFVRDPLTGLLCRRGWDVFAGAAAAAAVANGQPAVLAVLDLDAFGRLIAARGEAAGDDVLRGCAATWHASLGPGAVLGRVGGDEFAVLVVGCSLDDACDQVEVLRRLAEVPVTAAVRLLGDGERPDEAVSPVLAALDRAKRAGTGRTVRLSASD